MFDEINYKLGKVLFVDNDFKYLREDMLQVEYPDGIILDVGWYGKKKGFIIYVIKNNDWENPVIESRVSDIGRLKKEIEATIEYILQ